MRRPPAALLLALLLATPPGPARGDATLPGAPTAAGRAWRAERMWWLSYRRDERGFYYWLSPDGQNGDGYAGGRSATLAELLVDLERRVRPGERIRSSLEVDSVNRIFAPPEADRRRLKAWARARDVLLAFEPEDPWPPWLDERLLSFEPPARGEPGRVRVAITNLTAYRFRVYLVSVCSPERHFTQLAFTPPLEIPPFGRVTPEVPVPADRIYQGPGQCEAGASVRVGQTELARAR